MWAIANTQYTIPYSNERESKAMKRKVWEIERWHNDEDRIVDRVSRFEPFAYTFLVNGQRVSFIYDGSSVKPAIRTLRIYGNEALQPIIAILANATSPEQADKAAPLVSKLCSPQIA